MGCFSSTTSAVDDKSKVEPTTAAEPAPVETAPVETAAAETAVVETAVVETAVVGEKSEDAVVQQSPAQESKSDEKIDEEKKVESPPKPKPKEPEEEKLPKNVTSAGIDSEFSFVAANHNLRPSVMPLFIKEEILGNGASCEVAKMTRKNDGAEFAVKIMKRDDKWNPILFKQEYELLTTLNHPNILGYEDCYMDKTDFYLCTSLCKGGELFDKIKEKKKFNEVEAADIMNTIISAIGHCHDLSIVHRDLKPENIVYKTKAKKELVIIDFGDAKIIKEDQIYEDFVGTAFYLAPECIRNRTGEELKKSDMWTIGVIAYVLLTGRPPFYGKTNKEILRKIIRAKYYWPKNSKVSSSGRDFVGKLLQKEPANRYSAAEALQHKWLKGSAGTEDLGVDLLTNIANYSKASKLKKVLVRMLANEMTESDHDNLKKQFDQMDADGNGQIDKKELTEFIMKQGGSRTDAEIRAKHIIAAVDHDGDGMLNVQEYKNAKLSGMIGNDEALLKTNFQRIDENNDGFITHDELSKLFNWTLTKELISLMIKEIDENQDGKISFDEFMKAMKDGTIGKAFTQRKHMTQAMTQKFRKEIMEEVRQSQRSGGDLPQT